jgi:subtilisin family serine protease
MKRFTKFLMLSLLCIAALAPNALADNYLVIVHLADGADVNAVASAYDGRVVDGLDSSTYLLKVTRLTPRYAVTGLTSIEWDLAVQPRPTQRATGAVVSVNATTASDWYVGQPAFNLIGVPQSRAKSTGAGVIVADINAAVDYSHPSLRGHLIAGYDFIVGRPADITLNQSGAAFLDQSGAAFLDQSGAAFLDQSSAAFLDQSSAAFLDQSSAAFLDATNPAHGHGTLVAGIIAGIAPGAMIMPVRAFDDQGQSDHFTISKAIRWAVDHGANVINLSFGTLEQSRVMRNAIEYADMRGVTVIGSAGNENTSDPQFPAAYEKVISVAATDLWDFKAGFSNYGSSIEVAAPGVSIVAPYPGGYYAVVSGTSFAAPIVAGEAALIRAYMQGADDNDDVRDAIEDGVVNIHDRNPGYDLGEGRVHIRRALEEVDEN